MTISAGFNPRKAAQVIAYFAKREPGKRLNIVKAIKLVYLADRDSIANFGFPILDEDWVSMKLGPVNSTTYRFVNGEMEDSSWSEFLRDRANHSISMVPGADIHDWDELSDADIECLERVWKEFGHMDRFVLAQWTHDNIPEWEDPGNSSYLIPVSRILRMLEIENADEHKSLIEDQRKIARVFETIRE